MVIDYYFGYDAIFIQLDSKYSTLYIILIIYLRISNYCDHYI